MKRLSNNSIFRICQNKTNILGGYQNLKFAILTIVRPPLKNKKRSDIIFVIILSVCLVIGCVNFNVPKENKSPYTSHFTIDEVKLKLPKNLPGGWYLDSIEKRGTGMWGEAISKSNKTIVVIYKNSKVNVTTTFRDTGETFTFPKSAELYFFPDIWTEEYIKRYEWGLLNDPAMITRAVEYPKYLKQTSDCRIMYLGKDKEFIEYLNQSIT